MSITTSATVAVDPVQHDIGDATEVLMRAAVAMSRVERDVERLWRDAIVSDREVLAQHLSEVCHALRRAVRLLDQDRSFH